MITRAVGKVLGLPCIDGLYFGRPHTWIVIPESGLIIDCCPPDMVDGGPVMIDASPGSLGASLYKPTGQREVPDSPQALRALARVEEEVSRRLLL